MKRKREAGEAGMSEGKKRKKRLLFLNKQISSYGQRKQLGKAPTVPTPWC